MKILWGLVAIGGLVIVVFIFIKPFSRPITSTQTPTTSPSPEIDQVDFTASFTIITNGVTRNFNSAMYHNRSSDVYIEASDPTLIQVKKRGVTWNDFFQTLPFKLTKNCLTTGTNEKFCSGENGTLRFYLNDIENPNLLDAEIQAGDRTLIQFSS